MSSDDSSVSPQQDSSDDSSVSPQQDCNDDSSVSPQQDSSDDSSVSSQQDCSDDSSVSPQQDCHHFRRGTQTHFCTVIISIPYQSINQSIHPTTIGRPICRPVIGASFHCYTKTTGMLFGPPKRVADFTVTRKWKWVFVNVCECESPLSAATCILNSCQEREDATVSCGIALTAMIHCSAVNVIHLKY